MDLDVFRLLCADKNKTDQDVLLAIMAAKRVEGTFSDELKAEICTILKASHRRDLAVKVFRNLARYSSQPH